MERTKFPKFRGWTRFHGQLRANSPNQTYALTILYKLVHRKLVKAKVC
jgi:hypothetical protein